MPTGYTAAISKGIPFNVFVMTCARAMGALIMMRDEPIDSPIPERFEPSDFYTKKAEAARAEVQRLRGLSDAEAECEAEADHQAMCARYAGYRQESVDLQAKYEAMLEQVREWLPPTPDHEGFKAFMLEQLESSIRSDCDASCWQDPAKQTGCDWRAAQIDSNSRLAERSEQMHREEIERTEGRNAWLKALRESLPSTENECALSHADRMASRPRQAQAEPEGWIPVTERLPEGDCVFTLCFREGHTYVDCFYDGSDGEEPAWEEQMPSHWMPLPAAPDESDLSPLAKTYPRYQD
ncbi:DUF551 domain-containing protein [Cupriavidus sp. IDO]|uniref:DUF551 domain-containing protein n=1 Tax=Cupriavidus sp. IDO TaxID=1539142 RepID=UPI0005794A0B|nr:DUF551 domain-containing protein [Cupriavidus sp. IDO]KWR88787.1 hypothetical protein RM96_17895 [Cupriavidus sp. IDO]